MPADSPATPSSAAAAPAATRPPLFIAVNGRSGSGDKEEACTAATAVLRAAGHPFEVHHTSGRVPIDALVQRLARAASANRGVLVPAGGDGTINAAVNAAREHDVPLGVLPMGTFNYFAREHGVPLDPAEAARALMTGVPRPVTMGEINGRLFFNNASFGLYTSLIHRRESAKKRFGRRRIVAALSAVGALLEGQRPFTIQTIADQKASLQYTSMVFVACNQFQLEALGLRAAACSEAGALAVVLLRPTHLGQRLRLLLRTALRQLDEDGRLQSFCAMEFEVRSHRRRVELVIDGEVASLAPPLRFRAVRDAVRLIVPPPAPA